MIGYRLLLIPLLICFTTIAGAAATKNNGPFDELVEQLTSDGWDSTGIAQVFQDDRMRLVPDLVNRNITISEKAGAYEGFLKDTEIEDGLRFLEQKKEVFQSTLKGTGIPDEIAVAILKLESNLGRRPGEYPVFLSLATIYILRDPHNWVSTLAPSDGDELAKLKSRALRRSKWAYRELTTLLQICDKEGWNPLDVKGSWAGAFGMVQFIPTSYVHYARDGDEDGITDLFNLPDALASLACYLREAGWNDRHSSRRNSLLRYNPSEQYAECILQYSQKLSKLLEASGSNHPDSP